MACSSDRLSPIGYEVSSMLRSCISALVRRAHRRRDVGKCEEQIKLA